MLSDNEKDLIRGEVKGILSDFSRALDSVKASSFDSIPSGVFRKEGKGDLCDAQFRKAMFSNAPKKNDSCLIAEKGGW